MKKTPSHNRTRRNVLLTALLAALCIGIAELAACYHFEPVLYEEITAPVRRGAQAAAGFCLRTAAAFSQASEQAHRQISRQISAAGTQAAAIWTELTTPKQVPPESQAASEPALNENPTLTDPAITELNVINGQEILTGGTIPIVYFNQANEPWAQQPYGTDDIGRYGCGPVAMSMVVSSMTEEAVDPSQMAAWASAHGYWAKRGGSYLSIVNGTAAAYGLAAAPIAEQTPEAIQEALLAGNLLVALMGPGHFTNGGHFIILRGATLNGTILVADPNSEERSLMEWEPELLLEELSSSTSDGAPLWVISQETVW